MSFLHFVRDFFRDLGEILKGLGKKASQDSAEKLLGQNFDFSNAVQLGGLALLIVAIAGLWIVFGGTPGNQPEEPSQPSSAADFTILELRFFWGLLVMALIGAGAIITPPIARIVFPKTISVSIDHAGLERPASKRLRCDALAEVAGISLEAGAPSFVLYCKVSPDCNTVAAIIKPVRDYDGCRARLDSHIPGFSKHRNWTDKCDFMPDLTAREASVGEMSRLDDPAYPWLACAL